MKRLVFVTFLLASSVAADDIYLPLTGGISGDRPCATELRIVNPSESSTIVTIEFLEAAADSAAKTTQITLAAWEAAQWSDAVADFFGSDGFGVLRITSNERLVVSAVNRTASGITSAVPVLDPRDAIGEGEIPIAVPAWRSGAGIVNPDNVPALVTVSLHRDDQIIEEASLQIPARGMRLVRLDRLFTSSAGEANEWLTFSAPQPLLVFAYHLDERIGTHVLTTATPEATSPLRRRAVRFPSAPTPPQTVVLTASKDNTLYQTTDGSLSNGAGVHLFAGSTNRRELRRALLAFDVASQIPPGSQITRVVLTLHVSQTISGPESMELHRVATDWGQGSSNAGSSRDGTGAASRPGDATWIHTFFSDRRWSKPGGDFAAITDARVDVDGIGDSVWESSPAMIARVQGWIDQPSTNFGWIVIGNESTAATTKRFDSREISPNATRPTLTVDFVAHP